MIRGMAEPKYSWSLVADNSIGISCARGMRSASIGQLMTTSSPKWRWHSTTPMKYGKPPSALIAAMFGQSSISRRISRTGMSDGWMRGEKPHRYIGNSITARSVESQIAFV